MLSRPPRLLSLSTRLSCTVQTNDFLCHTHFFVPRHPLVCTEAPFFLLHPESLVCLPCQIRTFPEQGLLQQKNITITSLLTLIQNTKQLLLRMRNTSSGGFAHSPLSRSDHHDVIHSSNRPLSWKPPSHGLTGRCSAEIAQRPRISFEDRYSTHIASHRL